MAHRLRTLGLAALTLVTAGGLAGRRRRRRGRRQAPPLAAARLSAARLRPAEHRLLSEAATLLASSLDVEETAAHLASLSVASFGEWCVVYVPGTDDAGRTVVARHADAGRASIAGRFEALARDSADPAVVEQVLQGHAPVVASPAAEEHLAAAAGSAGERALLDRIGVASFAAVPLMAGDACVGVIVAGSRRPRRRFAGATIAMLIELGRRGAAAIVNARRYEDAQAAVRARDEMLAVVAHDLRSPLNVIEFATQRLRRDEPGPRRRSDDRSLDWIVGATRRAITLVRDLLESARLECGAFTLDVAAVAPADVIAEVARRAEPLGVLADVRVQTDVAPGLPAVQADRARLVQACDNLAGNALKFTPAGGSVTIGAAPHPDGVRFFVIDTGEGIAPADLDRMFERFWQARGADARGAGLGLFICKRIVEAHGGRVWAESRVQEGTTVSFTIAAAPEPQRGR